jgi:DNA polymerase III, delta subunit
VTGLEELSGLGDLPPATLLLGPDTDKMMDAAWDMAHRRGAAPSDIIILGNLSAPVARNLVRYVNVTPFGPFMAVIINMDGASGQAQNILLKVLEEPPLLTRFILVSSHVLLPAVMSRCQVIPGADQSAPPEADKDVAATVSAALKAAATGNLTGLDAALRDWGYVHHAVLSRMLAGAAVNDGAVPGITMRQARLLLGDLGQFDDAHPRLAAHAVLAAGLLDRRHHD